MELKVGKTPGWVGAHPVARNPLHGVESNFAKVNVIVGGSIGIHYMELKVKLRSPL